jgi:hypothetical protein
MTKLGRPDLRAVVMAALPGTRAQLEKRAGVSSSTIGKWLSILRAENVVHVGSWMRAKKTGSKRPVFVLGPGVDKAPPKTLTPEQSQARYNRRHPERRAEIKHRHYRLTKLREKGHGFLAALFR